MKIFFKIFVLLSLIVTTQVFADLPKSENFMEKSTACKNIATACEKAGYTKDAFWFDCMKPALLGNTVKNLTVDANDAKECRDFKIKMMKKELQEFQDVKSDKQ